MWERVKNNYNKTNDSAFDEQACFLLCGVRVLVAASVVLGCMCVCACVCLYPHACVCMCECACKHMCICTYACCVFECVSVSTCVSVCVRVFEANITISKSIFGH